MFKLLLFLELKEKRHSLDHVFRVFRNFSAADGCFSNLKVQPRSPLCDPFRALLRAAGERMQNTIKGPGARFSKVPVTFRARSYIVKSKSIKRCRSF